MSSKYLKFFFLNLFFLHYGTTCETCDLSAFHQHFYNQIESLKKSIEVLNTRLDIVAAGKGFPFDRRNETNVGKYDENVSQNKTPSIFDIRYDKWPKHCYVEQTASSCAQATACTRTSGIYNITITPYSNKSFLAYCDHDNFEDDWLYILKRQDGSVNFSRSWLDYEKGFGDVGGEHWIGLENLYALTNFNGPQELLVFLEDFEGRHAVARYDNFVVGPANDNYKLISLGRYTGTAGDSLQSQLGAQFSTYDNDNDILVTRNCAILRCGGFWYKDCTKANPTGKYFRGNYTQLYEGAYWTSFNGDDYSQKTIIFMIRRQRSMLAYAKEGSEEN